MKSELGEILSLGGFILRKLMSSERDALMDGFTINIEHFISDEGSNQKTLGLYWNSEEDTFRFQIGHLLKNLGELKVTKRSILSAAAHIFVPLGIMGPVVVRAKMIQILWKSKVDWDEEFNGGTQQWKILYEQLHKLLKISVPTE